MIDEQVQDDALTDTDTDTDADTAGPTPRRNWLRRWPRIVIASSLAAAAVLAGVLYFTQYRTDRQVDRDAVVKPLIAAASDGAVALLSYGPERLDSDFTAAKSHLTGEFLSYYGKFADEILVPAARVRAVRASASVLQAAVVEVHPESARVLLFVNQTTSSKGAPEPLQTASSVMVGLTKSDRGWLISAFEPI